jgi:hypothetical protein
MVRKDGIRQHIAPKDLGQALEPSLDPFATEFAVLPVTGSYTAQHARRTQRWLQWTIPTSLGSNSSARSGLGILSPPEQGRIAKPTRHVK